MNNLQKRQQGFLGKKPGAPTTKERYVKHPYFCPFCEHPVIEATKLEAFENIVIQWVRCDKCETEWHDIYELIDYEEVEELALAELNATPGDAEAEAEAREGTGL